MKKRILSMLLMAAMTFSLFAGCASDDAATDDAAGDDAATTDDAAAGDDAASDETFTFTFASENVAAHERNVAMTEFFKPELEERSGGRITVEIHTDGVLGKETELMQMLPTNAIQGYRGSGYQNLNEAFLLWNIPFLFTSYDQITEFQKSDIVAEIMNDLSDPKIYIPATGFTAFRQMVSNNPIEKPSDLEGLTFRTPEQDPIMDFYIACGANPTPMSSSDVYMALQQGAIDGACNAASTVDSSKWVEAAATFAHSSYMAGADPFMVNAEWYNSLPDDLKTIFDEVSQEMVEYSDKLVAESDDAIIQKLKDGAGSYTEIITNDDLAAEWQAVVTDEVAGKAIERGSYTQEQYDATVEFVKGLQ